MDAIAPVASASQVYTIAHELGLVPALVMVALYLHFFVLLRPFFVKGVAFLDSQKLTPEQLQAADAEVPRAGASGLLGVVKGVLGKGAALALILALGLAACRAAPAIDGPRLNTTLKKIQRGLELELAATAPISTAHAREREALRADIAAAVSATEAK